MADFIIIGDANGMIPRDCVSDKEWEAVWLQAVKIGCTITHWRTHDENNCYKFHKVRWRTKS